MNASTNVEVIYVDPEEILESPLNPRKHMDKGNLDELAESIKVYGVLQPVTLRRAGAEGLELVFGHRRTAAAIMAKAGQIPAIVKQYTDDQVIEAQVIENSQREDVHPLDEADGFGLLREHGYSNAHIAERIGRTPAFVAARLQLTTLIKPARKALDDEHMTLGAALVLARLPATIQTAALEAILPRWQQRTNDGYGYGSAVTEAQARRIIDQRFLLVLGDAIFDRAENGIAGQVACNACPKRTGNQPELFGDVKSKDICTDAGCFETKTKATVARWRKEPPPGVASILDGKAAKNLRYGNEWVEQGGQFYAADGKHYKVSPKAIKDAGVPVTIAVDEGGVAVKRYVKRHDFEKALGIKATTGRAVRVEDDHVRKEKEKNLERDEGNKRCLEAAIDSTEFLNMETLLSTMTSVAAAHMHYEDVERVCKRLGIEPIKTKYGDGEYVNPWQAHVARERIGSLAARRALALTIALQMTQPKRYTEALPQWGEVLAALKVDEAAIRDEVNVAFTAKRKEREAKRKKALKRQNAKIKEAKQTARKPKPKSKKKPKAKEETQS